MAAVTNLTSPHDFFEATKIRRSTISLKKESPIPDDRIIAIVKHAILYAPSSFNVQSDRAVILFGKEHEKLWDLAFEKVKPTVPQDVYESKFVPNITAYKGGFATICFFKDPTAVDKLPPQLGGLIKQFPEWLDHSNGMAQYIAWTALCDAGFGANLQHYQKYLGPALNELAKAPAEWVATSQLVFGAPGGPPRGGVDKQFAPIEPRVSVVGSDLN